MADVQDFINQTRTKLATLTPALSTQASSDYRTDLDDLAAGSTHYRIRHQEQQTIRDSNQQIQSAALELEISHHLADRFDERAYTEGNMLAHMKELLDKEWWRTLAAVREITSAPEIEEDVERIGNVISWSVLVIVAITP
jgi:hypothetical protein